MLFGSLHSMHTNMRAGIFNAIQTSEKADSTLYGIKIRPALRKIDVGANSLDRHIWTSESGAKTICGRRSRSSQHYRNRRSYVSAKSGSNFNTEEDCNEKILLSR
jgi:hypothetical protein